MSNGSEPGHRNLYDTEPYHIEKYVIPGAVALTVFFLVPWYLLGGAALDALDIGTAIIAALVAGHIMESLKVYQWPRSVRDDFTNFNSRVEGFLAGAAALGTNKRKSVEDAKSALFTMISSGERSEFAWNLVRWQKMTSIAVVLFFGGWQWLLFSGLAGLELWTWNPFRATFQLAILKEDAHAWQSIVSEFLLAIILLIACYYVHKFGRSRQTRTNDFYFQLILAHKDEIVQRLQDLTKKTAEIKP
jgi:hypothetical protein